jgi:hypothetical protein
VTGDGTGQGRNDTGTNDTGKKETGKNNTGKEGETCIIPRFSDVKT